MFPKIVGFPPKSSISIGFSIIKHPFWGTPIFGNTHILQNESLKEYSNTVDGRNPALAGMYKTHVNHGIKDLSTGAGFQPKNSVSIISCVCVCESNSVPKRSKLLS